MKTIRRKRTSETEFDLGSNTPYYPYYKFGTIRQAPLIITLGARD